MLARSCWQPGARNDYMSSSAWRWAWRAAAGGMPMGSRWLLGGLAWVLVGSRWLSVGFDGFGFWAVFLCFVGVGWDSG